jgi:hypothetical protein
LGGLVASQISEGLADMGGGSCLPDFFGEEKTTYKHFPTLLMAQAAFFSLSHIEISLSHIEISLSHIELS